MRMNTRAVKLGPLWALALGVFAAGMTGGCSDTPKTGTQAVESPEVVQKRDDTIKDMMKKGAYGGVQYDDEGKRVKGTPAKK
jgi:hypothetical protein